MHFIEKYILHHAFFTARRYLQPFASIVTLNALGWVIYSPPLPVYGCKIPLPARGLMGSPLRAFQWA